jgi:hypothetical protein
MKKETVIALRITAGILAILSLLGWVAVIVLNLSDIGFESPITVVCTIVPCFPMTLTLVLGAIAATRGHWLSRTLNVVGGIIIILPVILLVLSITGILDISIFLPIGCGVQFVGFLIVLGGTLIHLVTRDKEKAKADSPIDASPEPTAVSGKVCSACGAENPPDHGFCGRCGAEL